MAEQARNAVGAAEAGGKDHSICIDWDLDILIILDVLDLWIGSQFFSLLIGLVWASMSLLL